MDIRCQCCTSANSKEIDALIGKVPYREIATRYNVKVAAISRHKLRHLGSIPEPYSRTTPVRLLENVTRTLYRRRLLPAQRDILKSKSHRIAVCASRRFGKSYLLSAKLVYTALAKPGSTSAVLTGSLRQCEELRMKITQICSINNVPIKNRFAYGSFTTTFEDQSRILYFGLSKYRDNISVLGYGIDGLLACDEASFIPDEVFSAIFPALATNSQAKIVLASSAWRNKGLFFDIFNNEDNTVWETYTIPYIEIPFLNLQFIQEEKLRNSDHIFNALYNCKFMSENESNLFFENMNIAVSEEPETESVEVNWEELVHGHSDAI